MAFFKAKSGLLNQRNNIICTFTGDACAGFVDTVLTSAKGVYNLSCVNPFLPVRIACNQRKREERQDVEKVSEKHFARRKSVDDLSMKS
jgi:hypothetical protein